MAGVRGGEGQEKQRGQRAWRAEKAGRPQQSAVTAACLLFFPARPLQDGVFICSHAEWHRAQPDTKLQMDGLTETRRNCITVAAARCGVCTPVVSIKEEAEMGSKFNLEPKPLSNLLF